MPGYTTQALIEAYLKRSLTAAEITFIATAIPAVEEFINAFCNREFESTAATTKYYDGNRENELFIDDFNSIDSVTYVDSDLNLVTTLTELDDFVLYPLNTDYKNSIKLRGGNWAKGKSNIKVVGSLGFAVLPEGIQIVATQLIGLLLDNPQGLKERSIEGYKEVYGSSILDEQNKGILFILTTYKKIVI